MGKVIGSVVWTPQQPAAGQSVKIDVCDPTGKPYGNQQAAYVGINGVPGTTQFLQFGLAGDQKLTVTAQDSDGTTEQTTVTITVGAPVLSADTLAKMASPAAAALSAAQLAYGKATSDVSLLTVGPRAPYNVAHHVTFNVYPLSKFVKAPAAPAGAIAAPDVEEDLLKPQPSAVNVTSVSATSTAPLQQSHVTNTPGWMWDFGDGTTPVTATSSATDHDYTASLSTTDEFHFFHVTATAVTIADDGTPPTPTGTSFTRTLTVHNPYVSIKKRGYVVLPVTVSGSATKDGDNFVGTATISNPEPVAITLTSRRLLAVLEDTDALTSPSAVEALATNLVVPAKGSVKLKISAPFAQVAADATGFKAIFLGASSPDAADAKSDPIAGLKVRATAHFLVEPQYRGKAVPETPADPKPTITGKVDMMGPAPDPVPGNEVMPPVAAGNQCDPDNLPEDAPATLACQITPKTQSIPTNAAFLNASKGDIVLCPSVGSASLVDAMFQQLTPPQLYGHSGIMTRNYEQITHCTASESRLISYTSGGIVSSKDEGFDPDALTYAWPGVLTQTVDHAVNGEQITDPSSTSGQQYGFQDFLGTPTNVLYTPNNVNTWVLIPPVVVKPDPALETDAIRQLLTKVADDAFGNTGKYHYRFYCFTDPAATNLTAPASGLNSSSTWAQGTEGAVCSSFIWKMMKGRSVQALGPSEYATEAELSDAAQALDVQLDPAGKTLDGLFYYSAAQRQTCASWLHDTVWSAADAIVGGLGETLTHAADYYADELCSSFASDDNSVEDSDTSWENPSGANAISPNDFLAWNGPEKGGVLGYSEPLIYLPASFATVNIYEWAKVTAYGKLTGTVTLDGNPAASVTVTVPGYQAGTDKDGNYTFDKIPYGPYEVVAKLADTQGPVDFGVQTGTKVYYTGNVSIDLDKDSATAPEIKLKAPDIPYERTVVVTGYYSLDCSVWDWGSSHYTVYGPVAQGEILVGIGQTQYSWTTTETAHSATAILSAVAYYQADDSVTISFQAVLDGSSPRSYTATIAAGDSYTFVIGNSQSWLDGGGGLNYNGYPDLENDNDTLCCSVTFTNNQWSA